MSEFQHCTINQLIQMAETNPELQVVDIRDAASFAAGHIQGSSHLTNENIAHYISDADMDQAIIVVCYHGISSQGAAQYLAEQGFDQVYSLDGGYQAWRESEVDISSAQIAKD